MPPPPRCAICGHRCFSEHKANSLANSFRGIGLAAVHEWLVQWDDATLAVRCMDGTVVCTAKRTCYVRVNHALLTLGAFEKHERKVYNCDEPAKLLACSGVKVEDVECARRCGTPGCLLLDRHDGLCEPDVRPERRRPRMETSTWMAAHRKVVETASNRVGVRYQATLPPFTSSIDLAADRADRLMGELELDRQVREMIEGTLAAPELVCRPTGLSERRRSHNARTRLHWRPFTLAKRVIRTSASRWRHAHKSRRVPSFAFAPAA